MIELAGIQKYFGEAHVLKEINLKVESGEKVVVIGPSGSGKSTLIRCMNLLEKPTSGTIVVDGVTITEPKAPIRKVRESVAMVFQQFNLYPHKTVLENLTLAPILVKGVSKEEASESGLAFLDRVGLKEKADAFLGQDITEIILGRPVVFDEDPAKDMLAQERLQKEGKNARF